MIVTEQQARTKWCPMARLHVANGVMNRVSGTLKAMADNLRTSSHEYERRDAEFIDEQQRDCNCIASDCMMWRYDRGGSQGYCGLAGN